MGQRLVVTIRQDQKDIAKIYYHWSAYSVSALEEARDIINYLYDEDNNVTDVRLSLIKYCESKGGGITGGNDSDEFKAIQQIYPNEKFYSNPNRNDGLIALTEIGMDDLQSWSEGDIEINLDDESVLNSVFFVGDLNSVNEYGDEDDQLTLDKIPEKDINIEYFSFSEIDNVIDELENLDGYLFRKGTDIYKLIA